MKELEKRLSELENKVRILELLMESNQSNWDAQIRLNKKKYLTERRQNEQRTVGII